MSPETDEENQQPGIAQEVAKATPWEASACAKAPLPPLKEKWLCFQGEILPLPAANMKAVVPNPHQGDSVDSHESLIRALEAADVTGSHIPVKGRL